MRSLRSLAARLGCPAPEEYLFEKAIIDSRGAGPHSLFFALAGSRTDGHEYVKNVLGEGGAAVVSRDGFTGAILEVDSVEEALMEAGPWARESIACPVLAVTGSSGKTTTRKMLAEALSLKYVTDQTRGNLNNHLGMPMTLLNTRPQTGFLVLEMGMNHYGELLRLGWAARPDHALITNIGRAHMEFFESRDGIAHAKSELLQTTAAGGVAVIPAGEAILLRIARERELEIITHGQGGDCWLENGRAMPWGITLHLGYRGVHNMMNAVSAIAFAERMGIDPFEAADAIGNLDPMAGRGASSFIQGRTLVDESYNANPDSTGACLKAVAAEAEGQLIAVLGDMLELGENAPEYHREVLEKARELGFDTLILVGRHYRKAAEELEPGGTSLAADWREALGILRKSAELGSTILVKGSHSLSLGELVRQLKKEGF